MQPLLIGVDGRVLRFASDSVIRIGRSIDADVVLSAQAVSRAHAELRPTPRGWLLVDVGSAGGTYVGTERIAERPVTGQLQVTCGPPGQGGTLTITPEQAPVAAAVPPAPAPPSPSLPPVPPPPPAPVPAPAAGGEVTRMHGVPQMVVPGQAPQWSGPDLMVVAEGQEFRYRHPAQVTIGRAADNDIVVDDPAASRQHGRILAVPGGWVFQTAATANTYLDGRPTGPQFGFDETTDIRLGHPVAGERVQLIPILSAEEEVRRAAAKRRRKSLKKAAVLTAVGVLVVGTIGTAVLVSALGGDDEPEDTLASLSAAERDLAKAATVLISYEVSTPEGSGMVTGSGSIVSDDGLILTNAHVAAPDAEGLDDIYGDDGIDIVTPEYVNVHLTDPDDDYRTGEPDFRAVLLGADGDLDAAVIQIVEDADGDEVDAGELDLPVMPIGDSDDLESGDPVTILGFPGIAQAWDIDPAEVEPSVTLSNGLISTFIDTDARIAPGNSGGAAIDNDGRLIGIPSAVSFDQQGLPIASGRIRPLALVLDLLEEAGDEAR